MATHSDLRQDIQNTAHSYLLFFNKKVITINVCSNAEHVDWLFYEFNCSITKVNNTRYQRHNWGPKSHGTTENRCQMPKNYRLYIQSGPNKTSHLKFAAEL